MTVTFIFKQRKKIKNKSRKSQIPDDFIIFASDFAADFLARLKKTLGQAAAFFSEVVLEPLGFPAKPLAGTPKL